MTTIRSLLREPTSLVWMVLMLATVASTWWLSKDAFGAKTGTVAIFLVAAFKVRLVLLYFMELRRAPLPLRLVFEAWVLVCTGAILGLYLQTAAAVAA
jgi:caa(3)-type oxidase subunit IV